MEIHDRGNRILIREELRGALEDLGLSDLEGLRARAGAETHRGRSPHPTIEIRPGLRAILKESRRGGLRGRFFADLYLGDGRFLREIRVTGEAERRGVRVAPILASVSRPAGLGFCRHHYLIGMLEGRIDLREYLGDPGRFPVPRWRVLRGIARAIRGLHDAGIVHSDLTLGNVLVGPGEGGGVEVAFIDLDRSRLLDEVDFGRRMSNLLRLYRSIRKAGRSLGPFELSRFSRVYFGRDPIAARRAGGRFRRSRASLGIHQFLWRLGIR